MKNTLLKGHISPETAYLVDDYPYGFRLRCKIRYWVEFVPKKGCRVWSQTTNPKRGDVWNKAKKSTFSLFGRVLFLDENGHVQNDGLTEYCTTSEAINFRNKYADALPCDTARKMLDALISARIKYDEAKAQDEVKIVINENVTYPI